MASTELQLVSFHAVPEHWRQLGLLAREQGLNASSMLRLMMAQAVRRAEKQAAKEAAAN